MAGDIPSNYMDELARLQTMWAEECARSLKAEQECNRLRKMLHEPYVEELLQSRAELARLREEHRRDLQDIVNLSDERDRLREENEALSYSVHAYGKDAAELRFDRDRLRDTMNKRNRHVREQEREIRQLKGRITSWRTYGRDLKGSE